MTMRKNRLPRLRLLAVALGLPFAPGALAATSLWSGTIDSNWNNSLNWVWDGVVPSAADNAVIDSAAAPPATPLISTSGTANLLVIGGGTTGTLSVTGILTTNQVLIGNSAGAVGSLTIDGAGASVVNADTFYIGNDGSGTLTADNGAAFSSTGTVYLGAGPTGVGFLNVYGGASFTSTSQLFVGYGGSGTVSVTEGVLESGSAVLGDGLSGSGTVTLDGEDSSWENTGLLTVGGGSQGTLTVRNGATVTTGSATVANGANAELTVTGSGSAWTSTGAHYFGVAGNATVSVLNGAQMSTGDTVVARRSTSTSTVTVNGTGSSWSTGSLTIGGDAAETDAPGGNATVTVSAGAALNTGAVHVGDVAGATGEGILDAATWIATDRISVGYGGTGTVTVRNGAALTATGALLGHLAGSSGTVTVTGAGSSWTNTGVLYVGNEGTGNLTVSGGGVMRSTDGYAGVAGTASGTVLVTGAGSGWINSGDLLVAHDNNSVGMVTVSNGGTISSLQGILGNLAGAQGTMTVTGTGSSWTTSSDLNVGRLGTGSLLVASGGQVSGGRVYIANESGSSGSAVVTGTASRLSSAARLHVGAGGSGELTVSDGGTVAATEVRIATQAGSTGTLNLGGAAGTPARAPGVLETTSISFGAGSGTLNFNHTGSYTLAAAFSGTGNIKQLAGATTFTGNSATFGGSTTVSGGSLTVNGTLGGTLQVGNGGTLSGTGTVGTTTVAAGGTIAPDHGSGVLTVNGDLTLASGATYRVRATPSGAERIAVTGDANLSGNLSILAGSSEYSSRVQYTILGAGGLVAGRFTGVTSDFAFVTPVVTYDDKTVYLALNPNGAGYASVSTSPNQTTVANALTAAALSGDTSVAFNQLLSRIDTLSAPQAQAAFDSMSGRAHLGLASLGTLSSTLQGLGRHNVGGPATASSARFGVVDGRPLMLADNTAADTMTDVGGGLGLQPRRQQRGLWVQTIGGHGNTRSDGNASGYKSDSAGLIVGADAEVDDRLALGLAYQFNETRLSYDTFGDDAKVRGHQLAVYGRYKVDDWQFKAVAGYGWNAYDTDRDILIGSSLTRAHASYDGRETGVYLEAAYRIDRGTYAVEPVLSVQNVVLRQDGFREKGAGLLGLNAASQTSRSIVSLLGARLHMPLAESGLNGELRAFWSHQWADRGSEIEVAFQGTPGIAFQVAGLKQERDSAILGVGLSGKANDRLDLHLDYNLGVDRRQTQHTLVAGLRLSW